MSAPKLTEAQRRVLYVASGRSDGNVWSGYNYLGGSQLWVHPSALTACIRLGYLTGPNWDPDSHRYATLTPAGRAALEGGGK